jgi:hypothetical protein
MSVREMPNGQVEVELSIAGGAKEKKQIKMIDRHESYSNLDSWLAQSEFLKEYKQMLAKFTAVKDLEEPRRE